MCNDESALREFFAALKSTDNQAYQLMLDYPELTASVLRDLKEIQDIEERAK